MPNLLNITIDDDMLVVKSNLLVLQKFNPKDKLPEVGDEVLIECIDGKIVCKYFLYKRLNSEFYVFQETVEGHMYYKPEEIKWWAKI